MTSEASGSTWLLHTTAPAQLVGAVAAWTGVNGRGVVRVSASKDTMLLQIEDRDNEISIRVHEQLGLQLASLLLRVVSQNRELRRQAGCFERGLFASIGTTETSCFKAEKHDVEYLGEACLPKSDVDVRLEDAEDQWNLHMSEFLAEILSLSILDRLGQISATPFWAAKTR